MQFAAANQFSLGKSYRGYGPIGPWLVTADELDDPDDLALGCSIDGVTVQNERTSQPDLRRSQSIAALSAMLPLLPGDVIFTGTPAGVGIVSNPPCSSSPGTSSKAGSRASTIREPLRRTPELGFRPLPLPGRHAHDDSPRTLSALRGYGMSRESPLAVPPGASASSARRLPRRLRGDRARRHAEAARVVEQSGVIARGFARCLPDDRGPAQLLGGEGCCVRVGVGRCRARLPPRHGRRGLPITWCRGHIARGWEPGALDYERFEIACRDALPPPSAGVDSFAPGVPRPMGPGAGRPGVTALPRTPPSTRSHPPVAVPDVGGEDPAAARRARSRQLLPRVSPRVAGPYLPLRLRGSPAANDPQTNG